jgi:hypothetical protein
VNVLSLVVDRALVECVGYPVVDERELFGEFVEVLIGPVAVVPDLVGVESRSIHTASDSFYVHREIGDGLRSRPCFGETTDGYLERGPPATDHVMCRFIEDRQPITEIVDIGGR